MNNEDNARQIDDQDANSGEPSPEETERAEALAGIRRGLQSFERGEGLPVDEAFDSLRKKYGIPPDSGHE